MRPSALAILFCTLSGCLMQTAALVRGDRAGVNGAGLGAETVLSKLRFANEVGYEQVASETGDEPYGVFGVD